MEYEETSRFIADYTKGIDLTEEQKQSLIESCEYVAQVALDCVEQIIEALIQIMAPTIEEIAKSFEKLCSKISFCHNYNLKYNTEYAVCYYTRIYDKRSKIHRCRNNC